MLKLANGVRNLVSLLLKPLAYYEINALPGTLHTHSILASPIEKKGLSTYLLHWNSIVGPGS
jgi:hypothetical protein